MDSNTEDSNSKYHGRYLIEDDVLLHSEDGIGRRHHNHDSNNQYSSSLVVSSVRTFALDCTTVFKAL